MTRAVRPSRGYVIALALVVLVLVGSAATAIAIGLELETRTSRQEARRIHLVALGDAAMAEALAGLARSRAYLGSAEHPLGKGTIASSVRALAANRFEVEATSRVLGWERIVVAEVVTTGSGPVVVSWRSSP